MNLAQAILLIPPGHYLKCGCERNPETDGVFGSAAIFAQAPEDGWNVVLHPANKFLELVVVSISTDETNFEGFDLLVINMIVKQFGTERQKTEAITKLEQRAASTIPSPPARTVKKLW